MPLEDGREPQPQRLAYICAAALLVYSEPIDIEALK
jgi:hypothetical protein